MIVIEKITFNEILEIWSSKLWPGRTSPIKPMSSMTYDEAHDMDIYSRYEPTFFGAFSQRELIGVNSGHRTSPTHYRSRGLYVSPEHRQKGIASSLLHATLDQAQNEYCQYVWSLPRLTSINTYKNVGFFQVSNWANANTEFGPNCCVVIAL